MAEFWTIAGIAVVHLLGVGYFFGALCQKIKDLEDDVKTISNHLSSMQKSMVDIEVKIMNMNARLITLERKLENERRD